MCEQPHDGLSREQHHSRVGARARPSAGCYLGSTASWLLREHHDRRVATDSTSSGRPHKPYHRRTCCTGSTTDRGPSRGQPSGGMRVTYVARARATYCRRCRRMYRPLSPAIGPTHRPNARPTATGTPSRGDWSVPRSASREDRLPKHHQPPPNPTTRRTRDTARPGTVRPGQARTGADGRGWAGRRICWRGHRVVGMAAGGSSSRGDRLGKHHHIPRLDQHAMPTTRHGRPGQARTGAGGRDAGFAGGGAESWERPQAHPRVVGIGWPNTTTIHDSMNRGRRPARPAGLLGGRAAGGVWVWVGGGVCVGAGVGC